MRCNAYYTVETTLVMSIILVMIFSVVTYTLKLYEMSAAHCEKCAEECATYGVTSDSMRLERMLCGGKDMLTKGDK